MPPSNVVQLTEDEKRAKARDVVVAAARRGEGPSVFTSDDVAWAFRGHEDEIQQLEETAERSRAAARERETARDSAELLGRMTQRVLDEQEQEARAERRRTAEAEARRRLGWPAQ